jgi:hypothetical protein
MITINQSGNLIDQVPNYGMLFNYISDFSYDLGAHIGFLSAYLGTSSTFSSTGDVITTKDGAALTAITAANVTAGTVIGSLKSESFAAVRSGLTIQAGGQSTICLPLLCAVFLNSDFDIWHSIHQDSAFMPDSKTKFILTIHDLNFLTEKNSTKANKKLNSIQQKVDKASAVFSISNFTKHEIENHLSIQKKAIQVIYNGVESLLNKPSEKPSWLTETNDFLFCVGNITMQNLLR